MKKNNMVTMMGADWQHLFSITDTVAAVCECKVWNSVRGPIPEIEYFGTAAPTTSDFSGCPAGTKIHDYYSGRIYYKLTSGDWKYQDIAT